MNDRQGLTNTFRAQELIPASIHLRAYGRVSCKQSACAHDTFKYRSHPLLVFVRGHVVEYFVNGRYGLTDTFRQRSYLLSVSTRGLITECLANSRPEFTDTFRQRSHPLLVSAREFVARHLVNDQRRFTDTLKQKSHPLSVSTRGLVAKPHGWSTLLPVGPMNSQEKYAFEPLGPVLVLCP